MTTFTDSLIDTGESTIFAKHGGSGPPLLLLHGHPQTHMCWQKIAPRLAEHFTIVMPDLRGYGRSSKPATSPDHEPYSKRAMARDQIALMRHLGFDQFFVVGHDRGGRCAYRLALDHPHNVLKLAILDILPTIEHLRRTDMRFAQSWWHWFFLSQPYDFPEHIINADPDYFYLRRHVSRAFAFSSPEALEDYRRAWRDPQTIHAICEDYRAGVTFDYQLDEADRGKKFIECPLLVLWGQRGGLEDLYGDILSIWRDWAHNVQGHALDCGHYLPEEVPDETYHALYNFFTT